ncbi:MAG TPA: glycerophosphodiester phosphodiesterase family protein, partial [Acholeplasma sp.]|nr:glycerophosphodiester phosphodiesterase family protein [Acholeplasma sp.]
YVRSFVDIEQNKPYETTTDVTLLSKLLPVSLEAMFQAYEEKFYILEIKDLRDDSGQFNKAVIELLRLIKLYEMTDNVMVSSFDDDVLKAFKKLSKNEVYTSTATNETLKFVLLSALKIDFFYKPTDGAIVVPIKSSISDSQANLINKLPGFVKEKIAIKDEDSGKYYTNLAHQSLIDDARKHNMAVMFWTVNDKADMKKLILLGVDGIITDRPDLMVEVLVELDMYN